MTVGSEILAIIGTLNAILLGWLAAGLTGQSSKLDKIVAQLNQKRDMSSCEKEQEKCFSRFGEKIHELQQEDCAIWTVVHNHGHTGLPADSKVVR